MVSAWYLFLIWLDAFNTAVTANEYEYRCIDDQPCIIDCMNSNKCAGKAIYCPSNSHCVIHCGAAAACKHSIVYAQHSSFLSISVTASASNAQYLVIYTPFPWNKNYVKSKLVCAADVTQTLHHCQDLQIYASRGFNDIDMKCDDDSALCYISGSMQCGYDDQYSYDQCLEFAPGLEYGTAYECLNPEFCAFPHMTPFPDDTSLSPTNESLKSSTVVSDAPDMAVDEVDEQTTYAFHKEEEYDSLMLVIVGTLVISCTILLMMCLCGYFYVRLNRKQGQENIIQRYMMHSHSHVSHGKYMHSSTNTSLNLQRNATLTSSAKHSDTDVDITAILDDVHDHEQHVELIIGGGGGGVSPVFDVTIHDDNDTDDEEHDERRFLKKPNANHLSVHSVGDDRTPATETKSETDEKCSLSKHVLMLHEPTSASLASLASASAQLQGQDELDCHYTQIHPRSIEEMEAEEEQKKADDKNQMVPHSTAPTPALPDTSQQASQEQCTAQKPKRKHKHKQRQKPKPTDKKKKKRRSQLQAMEMDATAIIVSSAQQTKLSEHQKEILLQNLCNRAKCFGYQQPDVLYEEEEDYTSNTTDSDASDDTTQRRKKIFIIEQVNENEETGTAEMDQQHDNILRVFQHKRSDTMASGVSGVSGHTHPNDHDRDDNENDDDDFDRKRSNATTITLTDEEYGKLTQILEAPMTINIDKNHSINIIRMAEMDCRKSSHRMTLASLNMASDSDSV